MKFNAHLLRELVQPLLDDLIRIPSIGACLRLEPQRLEDVTNPVGGEFLGTDAKVGSPPPGSPPRPVARLPLPTGAAEASSAANSRGFRRQI